MTDALRIFKAVADTDSRAVVIRDADLKPVYANRAFTETSGYSLEEFMTLSFAELVPESTRKLGREEILPRLQAGLNWEGAMETRNRHGAPLYLDSLVSPVLDESGVLTHIIIRMKPLTEGVGLKRALSLSGELTRTVFSNNPVGIGVISSDSRFITANNALCEILGYPEQKLAGMSVADLTHPADWEEEKAILASLPPGPVQHYTMEKRVITRDRDPVWVKITSSVMRDPEGNARYTVGIFEDITIAKFMREALLDSEKRFWEILSTSRNVLYRFNIRRNRFDYISSYGAEVSRQSLNELMNLGREQLVRDFHPDDCQAVRDTIWKALEKADGKKNVNLALEYRRVGPQGSYLWFQDFLSIIFDANGELEAAMGAAYNITEKKRAEEELELSHLELEHRVRERTAELRVSEERLRTLIDNLPLHFWAMDADGRFSMQNAVSLDRWGDLTGKTLDTLDLGDRKLRLLKDIDRRVRQGETVRLEHIMGEGEGEDGIHCESIVAPIRIEGESIGILGVTMDITDRKRSEEALERSEITFRNLAENSLQGITLAKSNPPRIVFANSAICSILGYSKEEFLDMSPEQIQAVIHPDDRETFFQRYRERLENAAPPMQYEFRGLRKDGSQVWLEIFSTVTEYEGEPAVQAAYVDITERKKAQDLVQALTGEVIRAQEAERSTLARDLHDNVAQDLSTLKIGCGTLMADLAHCPGFDTTRYKNLSQTLERAISTVRGMAYELLPPGIDILEPAKMLEQSCRDFTLSTGVKTDFSAAGMRDIALPPDRKINLYRILQEALNNIKNHSQALRAKVRLVASHPTIILRIQDDGQGFDIGPRAIEALEQKRMGLWGMRERARLMGGTFDIKSQPGKGVKIVVEIPWHEAEP